MRVPPVPEPVASMGAFPAWVAGWAAGYNDARVEHPVMGELVLTQQALMQIVDYVLADEPSGLPRTSAKTKAHILGRLAQLASEIGA